MFARALEGLLERGGDWARLARVGPPEAALARLAAPLGGRVGASALHLETGKALSLNHTARFPLASTVKVAVALQVLARVDRGELALDESLHIEPHHLRPGAGIISRRFRIPGVALSVRNLLELALVVSDNTAADMLFDLAGGVGAVRQRLQRLGVSDVSVDRTILELLADVEGIGRQSFEDGVTPARWRSLRAAVTAQSRETAGAAFLDDVRDTATPQAMTRLLAALWRGDALGTESSRLLLDVLSRCETGDDRLKGLLPPGTRVAHKTGTIEGMPGRGARYPRVVNDAGIIDLPGGAGHVAMAVFVAGSPRNAGVQARGIARMARVVFDSFAGS